MTLLYLDFDGRLPAQLLDRITACAKLWGWPLEAVRMDRTARGWHVVIGVNKRVAPYYIVAAQAILGSDPHREAFNLMRVQGLADRPAYWRRRWNVLYATHRRGVLLHAG